MMVCFEYLLTIIPSILLSSRSSIVSHCTTTLTFTSSPCLPSIPPPWKNNVLSLSPAVFLSCGIHHSLFSYQRLSLPLPCDAFI